MGKLAATWDVWRSSWRGSLGEARLRARAMAGHGFSPSFGRCPNCHKRKGGMYKRGDEWFCILCYTCRLDDPRERETIAAELFPQGGFAIVSDGEPWPWQR